MFDILIFLLITVFFIFKLKNAFGNRDEYEKVKQKAIEEFFKEKIKQESNHLNQNVVINTTDNIIDITNSLAGKQQKNTFSFNFPINDNIQNSLNKINFDIDNFLKGSEKAVEIINDAFSSKDVETLETMLSNNSFVSFKKQLDKLTSEARNLKSSLISVLSKEIKDIRLEKDKLFIDVLFEMEQINFIENDKGEVVFGNKKKIDKIKEKWTFVRDLNFNINFWIVDNIDGNV